MNKLEGCLSLLSAAVINTKTKRHMRREGFVFVLQFQFFIEVHRAAAGWRQELKQNHGGALPPALLSLADSVCFLL